jgi:hydroxypyruvate reductase
VIRGQRIQVHISALDLDAQAALAENGAYLFVDRVGDLVLTGPTNTNVNDLTFVSAF